MGFKGLIKKILPPVMLSYYRKLKIKFKLKLKMHKVESFMNSVAKNKDNKVIKVGFIVQLEVLWDKQEPVFAEMHKNSDFEVKLLVVPKTDWSNLNRFDKSIHTDNDFS